MTMMTPYGVIGWENMYTHNIIRLWDFYMELLILGVLYNTLVQCFLHASLSYFYRVCRVKPTSVIYFL